MNQTSPKYCDNKSVGVIIENKNGAVALLKRAHRPVAMAPPSGHIDEHGSPEQTAIDEVSEELGLMVAIRELHETSVKGRTVDNPCPRIGGGRHEWWVYETNEFEGELQPSPDETQGAGWYDRTQLQELADRTRAFQAGKIPHGEWATNPGLEEVWLDFFVELGYVK